MALYGPWQQPADPFGDFEQGYAFTAGIKQRNLENKFRQQQLQAEQERASAYQQMLQDERLRQAAVAKAAQQRADTEAQKAAEESNVVPLPNNEGYTYGGRLYFNKPPAPEYPDIGSEIKDPDTGKEIGIWGARGMPRMFAQPKTPAPRSGTVHVPIDDADPKKGYFNMSIDDPLYQKWSSLRPTVTEVPEVPAQPKSSFLGVSIPFTGTPAVPSHSVTNNPPSLSSFLQNAGQLSEPAPSRQSPLALPPLPKLGDVQEGYRFKGGDPSDPNNWEQVNQ